MSAPEPSSLSPGALMDRLEAVGVRFALDAAGEVVVRAPKGVLTEECRAALITHREAIRALLAAGAGAVRFAAIAIALAAPEDVCPRSSGR